MEEGTSPHCSRISLICPRDVLTYTPSSANEETCHTHFLLKTLITHYQNRATIPLQKSLAVWWWHGGEWLHGEEYVGPLLRLSPCQCCGNLEKKQRNDLFLHERQATYLSWMRREPLFSLLFHTPCPPALAYDGDRGRTGQGETCV